MSLWQERQKDWERIERGISKKVIAVTAAKKWW